MPTILDDLWNAINIIGFKPSLHAAVYRYRKAWAEARWENPTQPQKGLPLWHTFRRKLTHDRPQWPAAWQHPGRVRYVTPTDRGITLTTDNCALEIIFFADDLVRVRYRPYAIENVPEPVPYAIAKPLDAWSRPETTLIQTDKAVLMRTAALTVGIALDDAQLFIADAGGQPLARRHGHWLARKRCHPPPYRPHRRQPHLWPGRTRHAKQSPWSHPHPLEHRPRRIHRWRRSDQPQHPGICRRDAPSGASLR